MAVVNTVVQLRVLNLELVRGSLVTTFPILYTKPQLSVRQASIVYKCFCKARRNG